MMQSTALAHSASSWLAQLELVYAKRHTRTVITQRRHLGPLTIQRPFYPEGDGVCHSYILHPPGGVVGGDRLMLDVAVEHDAHALLTTPASTKFYRSDGATAQQHQRFTVAAGGVLEYLPQDTILFDACKVQTTTRIELEAGAKFAGWEILCQGRPASGEAFLSGQCRQAYEIYRDGKPLVIERTQLQGKTSMQHAKWGMANYPVLGTMLVSDVSARLLEQVRQIKSDPAAMFSATRMNDVLVCRYLGSQGMQARNCFAQVWAAIRPDWIGCDASPPRIWDT